MPTDHRKDYSILKLFLVGSRIVDDFDEDAAVKTFLKLHPEAREADVRAELTRGLEELDEEDRQHEARIERERAQKA